MSRSWDWLQCLIDQIFNYKAPVVGFLGSHVDEYLRGIYVVGFYVQPLFLGSRYLGAKILGVDPLGCG